MILLLEYTVLLDSVNMFGVRSRSSNGTWNRDLTKCQEISFADRTLSFYHHMAMWVECQTSGHTINIAIRMGVCLTNTDWKLLLISNIPETLHENQNTKLFACSAPSLEFICFETGLFEPLFFGGRRFRMCPESITFVPFISLETNSISCGLISSRNG